MKLIPIPLWVLFIYGCACAIWGYFIGALLSNAKKNNNEREEKDANS